MKPKSKFSDDVVFNHLRGLSGFNDRGEEIPDPTPVEMPIGFGRPRPLQDDINAMISAAVQEELAANGIETWEEANDFETGEGDEIFSPHEDDIDPHHTLAREAEMRSGIVQEPDFNANKQKLDSLYADFTKNEATKKQGPSKRAPKHKQEGPEEGADEQEPV